MLTQKELKILLRYDPFTGVFVWSENRTSLVRAGDVAGSKNKKNGYIYISINNKRYKAHRLAWLYMTGAWPKNQIDHDDHVRNNNKWLNLNEATNQENHMNQSLRKDNTSGVAGVSFYKRKGKWEAYVHVNLKRVGLGCFTDKFEAICARMSANNKYGFHENHGRV